MTLQSSWQPPGIKSSLRPEYGAAFRDWLKKPVGKRFLELECARLNSIIPTLFGYDAILIGEPDFAACMQQSAIKRQFIINDDLNTAESKLPNLLVSRQDRLSIQSGMLDVVYLAHCLEFSANPHEVLREAYRTLRADGHLIISMFNPFSFWGIWRSLAKFGHNVPWEANFMSIVKLKDWLALLGFDIMRINYFGFNLPLNTCNYSSKLSWFEQYGQKLELPFGAAYIIEASKRVIPLTPVTQVWHARADIIDDLTEPTA